MEPSEDSGLPRIAVIGPAHPYRGGIAHFNEMTMQGLAARGHDVRAITFTRQYPELLFPGKTQYAEDEAPPEGVPAATRQIDTLNPLSWWRTAQHIRYDAPDALVFQYWMPFFAPAYGTIARLARRDGIRILAVVHNALPHERHLGDAWLSRYFLRAGDGFVVMSDAVDQELAPLRRTKAAVRRIEHPVYSRFGALVPREEARAELDLPPDAPVVLFFGFVRAYKGLHVLLEALPEALKQVPDLRLVVAGEFYDAPARYRQLIEMHDLAEHVIVHDRYIPSEAVPHYFGAADVVAQPYVAATQSGVAQIAFHFDTPLILTDVGGLAEVVPHEKAGLVVPPEDPAALARALARYFTDDLKPVLTEGVRQQKQKYHPDRLFEALEELL